MRSNPEAVYQPEPRGGIPGVDKAGLLLTSASGTTDGAVLSALDEHRADPSLKRFAKYTSQLGAPRHAQGSREECS